MIRVLLADDHAVVRSGLTQLLATVEDVEVVGAAADGAEAVDLALAERPDVVLMDLSMPVMDGIEAIRRLRGRDPEARIVVLTSFSDRERILDALDAGAIGYLLKDAEPDELIRGVRAAAAGEAPLAPKAASAVLTATSSCAYRPSAQSRGVRSDSMSGTTPWFSTDQPYSSNQMGFPSSPFLTMTSLSSSTRRKFSTFGSGGASGGWSRP